LGVDDHRFSHTSDLHEKSHDNTWQNTISQSSVQNLLVLSASESHKVKSLNGINFSP
jgi:hypothetical protein